MNNHKLAKLQKSIDAFGAQYPKEIAWMGLNAPRFDFAHSMCVALSKYGSLTERQLAAVQNCIERETERRKASEQSAVAVDVTRIEVAFKNAQEKGLKYPRLRLANLVFTPAKADGKNPGAVYVKTGDTYLGKIAGGKLFKSRDCTPEAEAEILTTAADPEAAAVAYGKRFGQCSICARQLTNQESIDRGIGPICANKFGW